MGKLIDVDELREAFRHDIMGGLNWDRILRGAKTVDAVEVRHGRWIPYNSKYGHDEKVYLCDQCNNNVGFAKMNFCPQCGARMDGEAHD